MGGDKQYGCGFDLETGSIGDPTVRVTLERLGGKPAIDLTHEELSMLISGKQIQIGNDLPGRVLPVEKVARTGEGKERFLETSAVTHSNGDEEVGLFILLLISFVPPIILYLVGALELAVLSMDSTNLRGWGVAWFTAALSFAPNAEGGFFVEKLRKQSLTIRILVAVSVVFVHSIVVQFALSMQIESAVDTFLFLGIICGTLASLVQCAVKLRRMLQR